MALRNQPYLPLYVDDFANDEKLKECSASSIGVYVYIMCVMHKSEPYGKIQLKPKYKTDSDTIKCFASQLTKQMPFDFHTVTKSLAELLHEKVLVMESDMLIQKRMVKDNDLSEIRANAGKNGGVKTKEHFAKANTKANSIANPVNVNGNGLDNGLEEKGINTVFINIGTEKFLMKPSQLAITDGFLIRTEKTLMALNGINTTLLWEQFDKKYTYHDFDDRNHFFNALALVGEKILNPPAKGYGINTTAPTRIGELKRPL